MNRSLTDLEDPLVGLAFADAGLIISWGIIAFFGLLVFLVSRLGKKNAPPTACRACGAEDWEELGGEDARAARSATSSPRARRCRSCGAVDWYLVGGLLTYEESLSADEFDVTVDHGTRGEAGID